jgi:mono/diheme cytochrome c family protein
VPCSSPLLNTNPGLTILRYVIHFLLICCLFGTRASTASEVERFIKANCLDCHDGPDSEGNFDVTSLSRDLSNPDVYARWVMVHDRVASGEMPPPDNGRLDRTEVDAFVSSLANGLTRYESKVDHGAVRRLNRVEYQNTLRDLLQLPRLQVMAMLPEDAVAHGYSKVPEALELSHVQVRKYLEAAAIALEQCLVKSPTPPKANVWREDAVNLGSSRQALSANHAAPLLNGKLAPGLSHQIHGNPLKDAGNSYRSAVFSGEAEGIALLDQKMGAHQQQGIQTDKFKIQDAGYYTVRFSTWGMRWNRGKIEPARRSTIRQYRSFVEPVVEDAKERFKFTRAEKPQVTESEENIDFYGDAIATHVLRASINGNVIGFYDAPSLQPTVHEFRVWLDPGQRISFHPVSLPGVGPANWGAAEGVLDYEGPGIAMDWMEMEGPEVQSWPSLSHRSLIGDRSIEQLRKDLTSSNNGASLIRTLLRDFADRAFRRSVKEDEIEAYAKIVADEQSYGTPPEAALMAGFQAILCSPDFLFLGLEQEGQVASRLSYFLWNGPPDQTLREAAAEGDLAEPTKMIAQVDRMLADPRSDRFVEHFLDQWLELRKIDFTTPDPELYPEFDPWLRDSMLAETRAWFRKLVDEDLSIDHLVDADFAILNQRLAELYRIPGVDGAELRKVSLPPESRRGGFLTQASILKVTADGTATSPVLRGVWIGEKIMGLEHRKPPQNVPTVDPDATGAKTIREQLALHQSDASCAACHRFMDPPGFALESFDPIGGFRDIYRINGRPAIKNIGGVKQKEPHVSVFTADGRRKEIRVAGQVDASGKLPSGGQFSDIEEFRELLKRNSEQLAENLVRQLAIYSTGSGFRFTERPMINEIADRVADRKHGIRSLIGSLCTSDLFLKP